MTNDPLNARWRELSWRPKLIPAESNELRAWLAAHPEAQADGEAEAALNEILGRLPDVPVASNFTARVLQTVELEAAQQARAARTEGRGRHWRLPWLPRLAFAAVFISAGLLSYRHMAFVQRERLARNLAVIPDVAALANPDVLANFDAIRAMSPARAADEELLAALLK